MAVAREDNLLTDSQCARINTVVERLDLSDCSRHVLGQDEEGVAGHDDVRTDGIASRVGADGDVNNLGRVDEIWVGDLRVRGND